MWKVLTRVFPSNDDGNMRERSLGWTALNILLGLNAHGRAGIAKFVASVFSVELTPLMLGYLKWGIAGAAVAATLPLTIMNVVYLPFLICSRVDLSVRKYFLSIIVGPVIHVLPFATCVVVAKFIFQHKPLTSLILGGTVGGAILTILYWRYVLPDRIRIRIFRYMGIRVSFA